MTKIMSSRPATLVNLGNFVREEISNSPPVNVPRKSKHPNRPVSSAPAAKHNNSSRAAAVGYEGGGSPSHGYSSSLVAPVIDEGEVLSTSATSNSSSVFMQRHRDAATWGAHGYGTMPQVGNGGVPGSPDPTNSVNFENECIKIQERNADKRQEHSTT